MEDSRSCQLEARGRALSSGTPAAETPPHRDTGDRCKQNRLTLHNVLHVVCHSVVKRALYRSE